MNRVLEIKFDELEVSLWLLKVKLNTVEGKVFQMLVIVIVLQYIERHTLFLI